MDTGDYAVIEKGTQEDEFRSEIRKRITTFGGVRALIDVSFNVREGELLAIIGPNGAGKTAWINCVTGYYRPEKGEIYADSDKLVATVLKKLPREDVTDAEHRNETLQARRKADSELSDFVLGRNRVGESQEHGNGIEG